MKNRKFSLLNFVIVIFATILLWEIFILITHIPAYFLPTPWQVIKVFGRDYSLLWQAMQITLLETLLGFLLAVFLGAILAINIAYFNSLRMMALPVIILSQALPTFAIAPLLVLWLGYGISSKIAVTTLMLFFPVTSNALDGLQQTPVAWLEMAKLMQGSRWQIMRYVQIPAALPKFASGVRIAAAGAPLGAVIGEWVGASQGLGFLILEANSRLQIDLMFAALFVLVALSLALYYSVDYLLHRWIRW